MDSTVTHRVCDPEVTNSGPPWTYTLHLSGLPVKPVTGVRIDRDPGIRWNDPSQKSECGGDSAETRHCVYT